MGNGTGKSVVGLDIEPGYVAAVQTSVGQVRRSSARPGAAAAGIVRDGEVVDVDTLAVCCATCSPTISSVAASASESRISAS